MSTPRALICKDLIPWSGFARLIVGPLVSIRPRPTRGKLPMLTLVVALCDMEWNQEINKKKKKNPNLEPIMRPKLISFENGLRNKNTLFKGCKSFIHESDVAQQKLS